MDLMTCSVSALAGSAGGAVTGYCTARRVAGGGERRRIRRARRARRAERGRTMRAWPGSAARRPRPPGDRGHGTPPDGSLE
ncbi:hypothetical protein [Pseudonocardia aurantiaca]